jgi:hypothetical protein
VPISTVGTLGLLCHKQTVHNSRERLERQHEIKALSPVTPLPTKDKMEPTPERLGCELKGVATVGRKVKALLTR